VSARHRASGRGSAGETTGSFEAVPPAPPRSPAPPRPLAPTRPPAPLGPPGVPPARSTETEAASPPHRQRRFARIRTIRARLAIILSVPTALLVALACLGVLNQFGVSSDANAAADNVELVLSAQDLIHSFQRERDLTSGVLGGAEQYRAQMEAQRRASDQNRAALDRLLSRTDSPSTRAVRGALKSLDTLESVRDSIDTKRLSRTRMLDFYTNAIVALGTASIDGNVGQDDLVLRRALESLHALGDAKEATALERGQLNGVFAQGRFSQDDYLRFTQTRAAKLAALAQFDRVATPQRAAALKAAEHTPEATFAADYERHALSGASGRQLNLSPPRWSASMTTVGYDLRVIQRGISDDIRVRAGKVKNDAEVLLAFYATGAIVTLLFALLLWIYTFRSIMQPLKVLTLDAREAAEHRLPDAVARIRAAEEPADVVFDLSRSTLSRRDDEFADVAGALDDLQQTAVKLAVEQAVMRHNTAESLANLGRRNQNLVRRQLGFISALEREESDPNALANLFELDHLATRMRRNAESLLVLVGEHSPRRWSGAVDVGDVLRSAFAEVEDYRRVILRRADDAQVWGGAAAEVSHLLAELVENALSFSPPDQQVEIQARSTGTQYHIAIVDQGVGMESEAMTTANARLRGERSFLVTPTRALGHYVVGRLAQRLGIDVWLHDSPLNGVTARIVLPVNLLVSPDKPAAETPRTPAPAHASPDFREAPPEAGPITTAAPMATTAVAVVAQPAPDHHSAMATTRNGLVKRQPRENTLRRPARPPTRPPAPSPQATPERSPDEVRSMLNTFRSGVHRAEQRNPGEPQ
jgi:signal transduction histidine kinase